MKDERRKGRLVKNKFPIDTMPTHEDVVSAYAAAAGSVWARVRALAENAECSECGGRGYIRELVTSFGGPCSTYMCECEACQTTGIAGTVSPAEAIQTLAAALLLLKGDSQ